MSSVIRIHELPAGERVDVLQELAGQIWVPMEFRSHRSSSECPAGYGVLRASGLGAIQVVVMDIQPITVARTPRMIRRADPDMLKLVMPVRGRGSIVVTQDGRQARLAPGEFASTTPAAPTR